MKSARTSTGRKKAKKPSLRAAQPHRVTTRVLVRARPRRRQDVLRVLCQVSRLHPEAEILVLTEAVGGREFALPMPSAARDGRAVRDLAHLDGREVWLTLSVT